MNSISKKHTVFLTGGTGFVGSHIAVELLKKGHNVIFLIRSNREKALERVKKMFVWHEVSVLDSQITVIEGDLSQHNLGMDAVSYNDVIQGIDEIWHCASDTSFKEDDRAKLEKVNVIGTKRILELAKDSKCRYLNYISTAYVFGKINGHCGEDIIEQNVFHNPYEETKYKAESMLFEECRKNNIIVNIFRPSIIIGDSESGRTMLFNALYYPLKSIDLMKNMFERDIENNNGKNAKEMGVNIDENKNFYIPLRFNTGDSHESAINLVTIDYVVSSCITIRENTSSGGIYNITNNKSVTIKKMIDFIRDYMKVHGIRTSLSRDFAEQPESAIERQFNTRIKPYLPYMQDKRIFKNPRTEEVLSKHGIECPEVDFSVLDKCINYAKSNKWKSVRV